MKLKNHFDTRLPLRDARRRAFTLAELLVGAGVGFMVLAVIATVFMGSARSFVAMGNYVSMNLKSRGALDEMTREIRRAGKLSSFSSSADSVQLSLTKYGTKTSYINYQWDSTSRQVTEWKTGSTTTNVLLTDCDSLAFSFLNSALTATTNASSAKAISVTWKCSRTILGNKITTEHMEQAPIVIRNN